MKIFGVRFCERKEIGARPEVLMIRYILFRCAGFGIFVHHFLRSDYDRALHDHPWPFVAVVLKGGYWEQHDQTLSGANTYVYHRPGSVLVRPAEWRHRVLLTGGRTSWSLVFVGRRSRVWDFFTPKGWCPWNRFDPYKNICGEDQTLKGEGECALKIYVYYGRMADGS